MANALAQAPAQAPRVITPAERAALFGANTRQRIQAEAGVSFTENSTVTITLPRVGLTAKVLLLVECQYRVIQATSTPFTPNRYAPWNLLRRIQLSANNGFTLHDLTGVGAFLSMLPRLQDLTMLAPVNSTDPNVRGVSVQSDVSAPSAGALNVTRMLVELPIQINTRDPIGLLMTQADDFTAVLQMEIGNVLSHIIDSAAGYTTTWVSGTITPVYESFSVPVLPEAMPDLATLKLNHESVYPLTGGAETLIRLPVGVAYRRIILDCRTGATPHAAMTDGQITGINLRANMADTVYRYNTRVLENINTLAYSRPMPPGVFVIDLSHQGLPGYGGSRDYIRAQNLTELTLGVTSSVAGNALVVREVLTRLDTAA